MLWIIVFVSHPKIISFCKGETYSVLCKESFLPHVYVPLYFIQTATHQHREKHFGYASNRIIAI